MQDGGVLLHGSICRAMNDTAHYYSGQKRILQTVEIRPQVDSKKILGRACRKRNHGNPYDLTLIPSHAGVKSKLSTDSVVADDTKHHEYR